MDPVNNNPAQAPNLQSEPVNSTPFPVSPSPLSSVPPSPPIPNSNPVATYAGPSQTPGIGQQTPPTKRRPPLQLLMFVIVVIAVVVSGVLALITNQKLATYAYVTDATHTLSVKFYKNAKLTSYSIPDPGSSPAPPHNTLISSSVNNKTPVFLQIDTRPLTSQNQQSVLTASYCTTSGANTEPGFSEQIPALNTAAVFCATNASIDGAKPIYEYYSSFSDQKANLFFIVFIGETYTTNADGSTITSSIFDLHNHQSDIQNIISSIRVK